MTEPTGAFWEWQRDAEVVRVLEASNQPIERASVPETSRSWAARYGVAVLAPGLALLLQLLLRSLVEGESPFLLFFGAVMVSAWFGGLGPGLLTTTLAALASNYLFLPTSSYSLEYASFGEGLRLLLFVLEGALISFLVETLRSARRQADASTLQAQEDREHLRQSEERFRLLVEGAKDYAIFMLDPEGRIASWNTGAERLMGYREEEIAGRHVSVLYTPEDVRQGVPKQTLRRAVNEGSSEEEGWYVRKDGTCFWGSGVLIPLLKETGSLQGFSRVMRNSTGHKRAEEEKARQARQAALRADVSAALAEGGTLPSTLQKCTEAIVRHLDAAFARVWTLNKEKDVLELQASAGMYTHLDGFHSRVPIGRFKIGLIAQERLPHLTNDVPNDPRVSNKEWARREGMVAFAGYPLIVEDRLVGVMAMFSRKALAKDTIDALAAIADAVAQDIERKRAEEALRKVREAERSRIARDLHDEALQDLTYALAEAQIIQMLAEDPELNDRLERVVDALERAGQELRSAVYDLRLGEEQDRPLIELVASMVESNREMAPDCDIRLEVEEELTSIPLGKSRAEMLRIIREALSNARRHAGTCNALVNLRREEDELVVEVSDDGQGFNPSSARAGLGLRSMRERAAALGGELEVESEPGKGTTVRLRVSLRALSREGGERR